VPGYFIDTSALAKLYHIEIGSQTMQALAASQGTSLIVSQLSLIEIQSVFATKVRMGVIDRTTLEQMRGLFFADLAAGHFQVVAISRRYFRSAEQLIRLHAVNHSLRTLDALQLAVALELRRRGVVSEIVASDKNLCEVAALEGLSVTNPIQTP
jgi:predicted nucleic acid-binding protein